MEAQGGRVGEPRASFKLKCRGGGGGGGGTNAFMTPLHFSNFEG